MNGQFILARRLFDHGVGYSDDVGYPTRADAILDRLLHNAYKITLRGESMRKRQTLGKIDIAST
jgi:IstB-like ATP binding protein